MELDYVQMVRLVPAFDLQYRLYGTIAYTIPWRVRFANPLATLDDHGPTPYPLAPGSSQFKVEMDWISNFLLSQDRESLSLSYQI